MVIGKRQILIGAVVISLPGCTMTGITIKINRQVQSVNCSLFKSPVKDTVVTNDRWGQGVMCNHGGFMTCSDRFNPGKLQPKK